MTRPPRVFMLVRSLDCGGAERQFVLLARGLASRGVQVTAATYYPGGTLRPDLEEAPGVRLVCLNKRGRSDVGGFLLRLRREIARDEPDAVYAFSFCGGLFATLATLFQRCRCVWSLRGAAFDTSLYRDPRALLMKAAVGVSRCATKIVVNSHRGRRDYAAMGMAPGKLVVIPNGVDVQRFRRIPEAGRRIRREWGLGDADRLVGRIGRLDPVKDYPTFIRAAARVSGPRVRFVAVGDGTPDVRNELDALVRSAGLADRWIWAGPRADMAEVYSALDVACSSSTSEGCPNVVAEAMACEVPCAVTDVGDSARLVGRTGRVVPARRPADLARAIESLLAHEDAALGPAARQRIVKELGLPRAIDRTLAVLLPKVAGSGV